MTDQTAPAETTEPSAPDHPPAGAVIPQVGDDHPNGKVFGVRMTADGVFVQFAQDAPWLAV